MSDSPGSLPPPDRASELAALIETLHTTEQRIAALTAGEVDAVSNREGRTFLLQEAQEGLRQSEAMKQAAILSALPAHIALLDTRGVIICVNESWRSFSCDSVLQGSGYGVGVNYLEACDGHAGADVALARHVAAGLRAVLQGELKNFSVEYACREAMASRWFQLVVCPLADRPPTGAIVMHMDITERMQAQEAMKQSAELLSAVAAGTPDMVFVKDRAGRYLLCNDAFSKFLGRPVRQVIGEDNEALFGPDGARLLDAADARVMHMNDAVSTEDVLMGASGARTFLNTKAPYRDAQGQVIGVIGIGRDITARKQAEQRLHEGQALLSMAGRLAQVGSWVVELPARKVAWSDVLATLHGEAEGFSPSIEEAFAYYTPEHQEAIRDAFSACVAHGTPFDVECQILTAQGKRTWVRAIGEAVHGPDGAVCRIQGALQDISQRKEAERETRLLASRLTNTLESITDGFLTLDREWRYTYVNTQALRMLERHRSDLIGRVMWDTFPQSLGNAFERGCRGGMEALEATTFEAFYEPRNAWISVHCYPSDEGLSVYFRDVTERKLRQDSLHEMNAELEQRVVTRTSELNLAREEAEQANRAKSSFLAAMSHEIRTPMNGVVGMIDVLEQSSLKSSQAEIVKTIKESAYALLGIVDDVLDFSKIEAGYLQIDSEPFSVEQVVERVCDTLDHLSSSKGVLQRLFIDPAIPARLLGDAARLRQVLLNLVGNAIKFSSAEGQAGKVDVRAVLVSHDEHASVVAFSVSDNGIGMDAPTLSRLFMPFTQADDSTTKRFGGTGLGLSISSRLAGLMGGDIQVASQPGQGSVFTMQLAFKAPHDDLVAPVRSFSLSGARCLLVGMPTPLPQDLTTYLEDSGAVVHAVATLSDASIWFAHAVPGRYVVVSSASDRAEADKASASCRRWNVLDGLSVRLVLINRAQPDGDSGGAADEMILNGHALHRDKFLNAVAMASGTSTSASTQQDEWSHHGVDSGFAPLQDRERGEAPRHLILVAEDNEINQTVIRNQLELLGFTAELASNGRDALDLWQRGDHMLLLTDLHMPVMDGYELCAAIRDIEGADRHMPIVALTANALKGESKRCTDLGMDDYMTKPLQLNDLHAMLQKWMPATDKPAPLRKLGVGVFRSSRLAPVKPPGPMPAADLAVLIALVGNDALVIRELLTSFQECAVRLSESLRQGVASGSAKAVSDAAHALKSGARSIGAMRLGTLCDDMEATAKAGRYADLSDQLPEFELEMASVHRFLDKAVAG